ncbi:hypothetical protein [Xanthobacter sediminis]
MISFSSLLPGPPAREFAEHSAPHDAAIASDLRLALSMRDWVDPTLLLPQALSAADRAKVLNAVAPDVQVALIEHPGQWLMRDQERRRFLTSMSTDQLEQAIAERNAEDAADPVRTALELRRRPLPTSFSSYSTEVLLALGSTFAWLDPSLHWQGEARTFWAEVSDPEGAKQRVAATLARRRRREDVERMTKDAIRGRDSELGALVDWATAPATGNGRFLYLSGIGGAGKSTLFAHLEKRLGAAAEPPLLVHIDCDVPAFDPTDPVALDLALFPQLSVTLPAMAPDLMRRAQYLSQATREADAAYLDASGLQGSQRGRQRKAEASRRVESYTALESVTTEKSGVRSSISYGALAELCDRTVILLFDTAELMLARAAVATSSEAIGTTDWLASLTGLMNGQDVRVLMAGRNPPTDLEVKSLISDVRRLPGWQVGKPLVLDDLSRDDAAALLTDLGVDSAIATKAARVLPRTPLILKIAAEVYRASAGDERADFIARLDAANIDPAVARRYLTERVVSHLASPVARPYALAAMALPRVTVALVESALLVPGDGKPERRLAREVYYGLRDAGWLVRVDPGGRYLTFHPELRRLALELMASDPDSARLLDTVRQAARDYHARRRRAGDATFRAYYDIMLKQQPLGGRTLDLTLLGAAIDDLPAAARSELKRPKGRASARPVSSSIEAWTEFVEGSGRRDGEGDRLVKRGHADAALKLYRDRPVRPEGKPPTFVLQALADGGYYDTGEVDADAIAAETADELERTPDTLSNSLRSRIYWLTRFQLMAQPGPLSDLHQSVLATAARRFSGSGPVLLFPSITSVAEAFAPKRGPIAPSSWFGIKGSIESETRMFLVHHLLFGRNPVWQPHIDALLTLQPDWPQTALDGGARVNGPDLAWWMQQLRELVFPFNSKPKTQLDLNSFLRRLRIPISLQLTSRTSHLQAVLLLRGLTTEFHRPLRATMTRHVASSAGAGARLIATTVEMLDELPLRISELQEYEWRRRAERDISAALGIALPFIDRARRLPSFCERLLVVAGRGKAGGELVSVASAFLEWDNALSVGLSSDWSRWANEGRASKS